MGQFFFGEMPKGDRVDWKRVLGSPCDARAVGQKWDKASVSDGCTLVCCPIRGHAGSFPHFDDVTSPHFGGTFDLFTCETAVSHANEVT